MMTPDGQQISPACALGHHQDPTKTWVCPGDFGAGILQDPPTPPTPCACSCHPEAPC